MRAAVLKVESVRSDDEVTAEKKTLVAEAASFEQMALRGVVGARAVGTTSQNPARASVSVIADSEAFRFRSPQRQPAESNRNSGYPGRWRLARNKVETVWPKRSLRILRWN
jgi:hypothetical protein